MLGSAFMNNFILKKTGYISNARWRCDYKSFSVF